MVKGKERWVMFTIGAGMIGCNALAGIREGEFDPCVDDAGNPGCEPVQSSSSSSGGGSASASASVTSSAAGGHQPACGDGVLDSGEECDDKNTSDDDGCTKCKVDCSEPKAFKDPKSSHCFWVLSEKMSFFKGSVMCQSSTGGQLATVTSAQELKLIDSKVGGPVWIGASDLETPGTLEWLDKEPWGFVQWGPGEPSHGGKDHCVVLDGEPLRFGMSDCDLAQKALCERAPIVNP